LRSGRSDSDLVFGSRPDHPFTPTNIRKRALRAWEQANAERREDGLPELEPIGLHECRHTYVTLMHAAGDSLETIGDYVGHSSAHMTDRFRHLIKGPTSRIGQAPGRAPRSCQSGLTGPRTGPQGTKAAWLSQSP
jgi:integrase